MKKKLLFVLPAFTFGGTVVSTFNMLSLLDPGKYEIFVYAMSSYGPYKEMYSVFNEVKSGWLVEALMTHLDNYPRWGMKKVFALFIKCVNRLTMKLGFPFSAYVFKREAKRISQKNHFDVASSCQEGGATLFCSFVNAVKRNAWFRSEYSFYVKGLSQINKEKEQCTYKKFDNVVCVSKTTRDDFASFFPLEMNEKIVAIHNIQNVDEIEKKASMSVEDPFDERYFNIVSVGRIAKQKRFCEIPKLLSNLNKIAKKPFRWYIIGDGNVEGEADRLRLSLKQFPVEDKLVCLGGRLNPYPYIKSAHVLVNTSSYEACPRVVAEAKILKTPVICADFSSSYEFVDNGVDGFIDSLQNLPAIIGSLINDENLYNKIKQKCLCYEMNVADIMTKLDKVF